MPDSLRAEDGSGRASAIRARRAHCRAALGGWPHPTPVRQGLHRAQPLWSLANRLAPSLDQFSTWRS